jgi:hypothetical protein
VSTVADINSVCGLSDAYLSLPSLSYAPATRPHGARADCVFKINRNQVIRKVPTIPLGSSAPAKICWPVWRCSPLRRRHRDQSRILDPSLPADPKIRARPVKAKFQATVRSAISTLPFVSGLNSTATRKMAKPTTVVTKIGPDRPIW